MSAPTPTPRMTPFALLWRKWKALRLPWRRRFLAGSDLQGNTFWEFPSVTTSPTLSSSTNTRHFRRIVEYSNPTYYSDVSIPPAWHQWLRHTRAEPPSLEEQRAEVERQRGVKILARLADERWKSKPSFLDKPKDGRIQESDSGTLLRDRGGHAAFEGQPQLEGTQGSGVLSPVAGEEGIGGLPPLGAGEAPLPGSGEQSEKEPIDKENGMKEVSDKRKGPNPWDVNRGGPSEEWKPQAWDPSAVKPRARR